MNSKVAEAQAALDTANALYAPTLKASFRYDYDLSISRKANAERKAKIATEAEKAFRITGKLAKALLAAKQEARSV